MPEKYVEIVANDAVAADQFDATNETARSGNTNLGVTTNAVSSLGSTTATLEGTLDLMGGQSSVTVYFQYREAGTSTWTDTATQSLSSTGDYNQSISGLTDGTLYEYRAAAESEEAVGGIVEFRAGATLAEVTTNAATEVGETEATLEGTLDSLGSDTEVDVYFQWREADTSDFFDTTVLQPRTTTGDYDSVVTGLAKDTTYEYRAAASSNAGDNFGALVEVTPSEALAVTTNAVTDLEATTATLNGTLDARGAAIDIDVNFEYREAGTADPFTTASAQTLSQPGDFSEGITGLTDGTTYEYRALADNGVATAEGSLVEFTAGATLPTMLTFAADNVGATSADFNGELFLLGSATSVDVYFEWREVGETALNSTATQTLSSTGLFDETVSGLTEGTTYEFRAAGSSTSGDAFGSFVEVVPGDQLPTVETDQPDSITDTGARLWGDLTDLGSQLFVETGFEYWEVGVGGFQTEDGPTKNSTGRFAAFADTLQTGTTYGYRALADSQAGRAYGGVVEFTTGERAVVTISDSQGETEGGIIVSADSQAVEDYYAFAETDSAAAEGPINQFLDVRYTTFYIFENTNTSEFSFGWVHDEWRPNNNDCGGDITMSISGLPANSSYVVQDGEGNDTFNINPPNGTVAHLWESENTDGVAIGKFSASDLQGVTVTFDITQYATNSGFVPQTVRFAGETGTTVERPYDSTNTSVEIQFGSSFGN